MILTEVAVSGTVGKQVVARTKKVYLRGITLTPSAANATIKIRDGIGGVSGETVYFARATSANARSFEKTFTEPMYFTKGLHVTVIGSNAVAYLELD